MNKRWKNRIIMVLLLLLSMVVTVPLLMILMGSLTGEAELDRVFWPIFQDYASGYSGFHMIPLYPTGKAYVKLLLDSPAFFRMFWNTCQQVFPMLAGQMLVSIPAAWGFSHYTFPMKKVLFYFYILLMILPFQVTMVPNYLVIDQLHLMDSHWAVILPGIFATFPVFLLVRFFDAIPVELFEAAWMDGAGEWRIFFAIGIPLGKPGIASAAVMGFLEGYNALEPQLTFLKSPDKWPLSLYLPRISTGQSAASFAASVLAILLPLFLFLYGQPYLEMGIQTSGVKE